MKSEKKHRVEKIGGSSMRDYYATRDNIFLHPALPTPYARIFVVSAYAGITNKLLEHKKNGEPGVYALFASGDSDQSWQNAFKELRQDIKDINQEFFTDPKDLDLANEFIATRLDEAEHCLRNLKKICEHGHFSLEQHLKTVRELLASIGEAHSAWNTAHLLKKEGINAVFVDLSAWDSDKHLALDERILHEFSDLDLESTLPICTGYAHSKDGMMTTFDRGYSEMTFSRIAVLSGAAEAIIHKEFHLSSADPKVVTAHKAVPIGRTNYDVADQLANLGMEAIHPRAAKGLRQHQIPLRVKNTFEPEHAGTLITGDYVSQKPRVEIIAGCRGLYAIEFFDQDIAGDLEAVDQKILSTVQRFRARVVSKDINANSITHYLATNLKNLKRIRSALEVQFPDAEIDQKKIAIVSAMGSDMKIPGILSQAVAALAEADISVLAMHQSMRQVDMQFVVHEDDFNDAIRTLHKNLIEVHEHGVAICLAS